MTTTTTTSGSYDSRKRERDEMSSPSSDDLEYTDAMSGSPPNSGAMGRGVVSPKSPTKKPLGNLQPTIRKRKPKTYRSVISDIFDGKLVSTVQCLTCNRVSLTTEAFQVKIRKLCEVESLNYRYLMLNIQSRHSKPTLVKGYKLV